MPDSPDLDEQLAALLQERARLTREYQAALIDVTQRIADLEAQRLGLQRPSSARTISGNMAHAQQAESRRPGRPTTSKHPFPLALEAAGSNVAEWARKHGYEREVVKAWFARGAAARRIPAAAAKSIEREFHLPANDTTWPNGIR